VEKFMVCTFPVAFALAHDICSLLICRCIDIISTGSSGDRGDLWRFGLSTLQWAWMTGSSTGPQQGISLGGYGTTSTIDTPGTRVAASMVANTAATFIYLFGGSGNGNVDTTTTGYLDQLWRYTVSNNQWTWLMGSSIQYSGSGVPTYPSLAGLTGATTETTPGARGFFGMTIDTLDRIWIAGGIFFDTPVLARDIWMYSTTSSEWRWVGGQSSQSTAISTVTMEIYSTTYSFGSRHFTQLASDDYNNIMLFGGLGSAYLGDIWSIATCSAGSWKETSYNTSICGTCTAGSYSLEGATTCTTCAASSYATTTGLSVCTSCVANSFSGGTGSTTAYNCSKLITHSTLSILLLMSRSMISLSLLFLV
jgi:hypothetical protein